MTCNEYPWSAYRRTHVELKFEDGSTQLVEQTDKEVGKWPFSVDEVWILTAFNPKSELLTPAENSKRHLELGKQLDELGLQHFQARGFDPQGAETEPWSEDGYAVMGNVEDEVLKLANFWEQNAVFVWRANEWLIKGVLLKGECKSGWKFL